MHNTILIVLALAIAGVLIIAVTKPDAYTVSRSQLIDASADKLHAIINTPREFERWSPYSAKDPQMQFANPRFTAALAAYAISCLAMFGTGFAGLGLGGYHRGLVHHGLGHGTGVYLG